MSKPVIHGTNSGYTYHKCHCGKCVAAHGNYVREWRRKRNGLRTPAKRITVKQVATNDWVLLNFPVAIVARKAWPNDDEAIAAAFGATS